MAGCNSDTNAGTEVVDVELDGSAGVPIKARDDIVLHDASAHATNNAVRPAARFRVRRFGWSIESFGGKSAQLH